ncbi:hypothetical protein [Legionella oakridgensis]|uniref:Uncharacterized protein n=3 Tax=Legionella oakridgensis TaxID=29423 RepID=W0B8L1_9GAMM|nr:hypothetical protein [Legionella oakridgensis]AHE66863.1 hypothetical protein Loa_01310 [Legionella oakridgensis ATCC 33761 = DSM 21215]ETO93436.1 hypothetical protein LOR_46c07730 [Legionella oakridgensis RV-2-2007]KTD39754.1 hypothetical protein Loak_0861 [Legionella oakridgensis]STY19974.1 Uncharacterised protein [Legionella longbeachae]
MKKAFRLLSVILDAIVGVADDEPSKPLKTAHKGQEFVDADLISLRKYKKAFEQKNNF